MNAIAVNVRFGDCDLARIMSYPKFFRSMDHALLGWLRLFGGHSALCATLQFVGIGLMEASMRFQWPARDGDEIRVALESADWAPKTLTFTYRLTCGARPVALGREVRGLFTRTETGIQAADMMALRDLIAQRS